MRKSETDERNAQEANRLLPVAVPTVEIAELTPQSPAYLSWMVRPEERPAWEMFLRSKHPALNTIIGETVRVERFAVVSEIMPAPDTGEEREVRVVILVCTGGKCYRTGSARVVQDLMGASIATRATVWPNGIPFVVTEYKTVNGRRGLCLMPPVPELPKD